MFNNVETTLPTLSTTPRYQFNDDDDNEEQENNNTTTTNNNLDEEASAESADETTEGDSSAPLGPTRGTIVEKQLDAIVRIARDISERAFQPSANSYLPRHVMARFEDPFIALTYCVDIEMEHERGAAEMAEAFTDITKRTAQITGEKKKLSLKRSISKSLKIRPTPNAVPEVLVLEKDRQSAALVAEEARLCSKRLSDLCHPFAMLICRLARIRNRLQMQNVLEFMPYVLVHHTVARHPRLTNLKIGDNSLIIEVGRACARIFVLLESYSQVFRLENAERRWNTFNQYAGIWFIKQVGSERSRELVSVDWRLDPLTHAPLASNVVQEHIQVMTSEMPFIMIGVLHSMSLYDARDRLLWSMYQDLI
jgi:hypothetical protein